MLVNFLVEHQLIVIEPFHEDGSLREDLVLRSSDLTDVGNEFFKEVFPKWSAYIDRGGDIHHAGMYTAFYSGMRDLKTKLIEAKDELGGRMLIYPEKMIWDVGGVTPILYEKLIAQLAEQAKTFDPTITYLSARN